MLGLLHKIEQWDAAYHRSVFKWAGVLARKPHNGGKTAIIHFKNGGAGASALGRSQGPPPPFLK